MRSILVVCIGLTIQVSIAVYARGEDDTGQAPESPESAYPPPSPKPMSIEELSVNVGFESGLERRTVRTDRLGFRRPRYAQTDLSYTFQETLGLESRGNLIDERTLLYDVAATWFFNRAAAVQFVLARSEDDWSDRHIDSAELRLFGRL